MVLPKECKTSEKELILVAAVEGKRIKGRPNKRRRDDAEEDLNVLVIKNGQAVIRNSRESGKVLLVESFVDLEP